MDGRKELDITAIHNNFIEMEKKAKPIIDSFLLQNGMNAWPAIRTLMTSIFHITYQNAYFERSLMANNTVVMRKRHLHPLMHNALKQIPKGGCAYCADDYMQPMHIQGKLFNPYLDPLAFAAKEAGLLPIKIQLRCDYSNKYYITPLELIHTETSHPNSTIHADAILSYRDYALCCVEHNVPALHMSIVLQFCNDIEAAALLFEEALSILQPKIVISKYYYNSTAHGLALCCNRLGIPFVDYQHGTALPPFIPCSFGYIPPKGFACVPEWFFTWGTAQHTRLSSDFEQQSYHKVATVCPPMYYLWKTHPSLDNSQLLEKFLVRITGKVVICVALAGAAFSIPCLQQLIRDSPDDWIWLLRQHPSMPYDTISIANAERHKVEEEAATGLNLHTVLSHSHHMVTCNSSTAYEALDLHNIQTTFIGSHEQLNFIPKSEPAFYCANTAEDALHNIQQCIIVQNFTSKNSYISGETKTLEILLKIIASRTK